MWFYFCLCLGCWRLFLGFWFEGMFEISMYLSIIGFDCLVV
jgi:hypothetical protein